MPQFSVSILRKYLKAYGLSEAKMPPEDKGVKE